MASIASTFFKKTDKDVIFIGKYMEVYIPSFYFEREIAEIIGNHFKTTGIFNFMIFSDIDGKQPTKLRTLNLPCDIYTYPSGGFEEKTLDLIGQGEEKYHVLKYYTSDVLCASKVVQSPASFKSILELTMAGKLPATIPYDAVIDIWAKSFTINGVNFDVPDSVKEMIISQIYRSKSDPKIPFAKVIGKNPKTSPYDYQTMNARNITKNSSTYAGFTFEDMDEMIISGCINNKANKPEHISPMEQIMRF